MSTSEKGDQLPLVQSSSPQPLPRPKSKIRIALKHIIPLSLVIIYYSFIAPLSLSPIRPYSQVEVAAKESARCPVQPPVINIGNDWDVVNDHEYASLATKRLSRAVQINTESYDNFPKNASDPIFDKHYEFSHYLSYEFSKLFKEPIKYENVNVHGHLFTWEGKNKNLKPILLMAHTDTVPVLPATLDQWSYPPFEGKVTVNATQETPGTWIWGRGVSDCKNTLLAIYGSLERLVTEGYEPERTIIVANGFDEEIGGSRGSGHISKVLLKRYGNDGIAFLVDEGFTGISNDYGATVASFGMAEKGSVNVNVKVETLGGHSSVPPPHTAIGIISLLLAELEAHPSKPTLSPQSPFLKSLNCLADYAPEFPKSIKHELKDPRQWDQLAQQLAKKDRVLNSFLATTQAIDLINGGVKVNALPEVVDATVNYRISFTSSVNETLSHVAQVLRPLAKKLGYTISAFDEPHSSHHENSTSHITLSVPGGLSLEPAPITSDRTKSFALLGGTAKAVFGNDTIASPSGMFANTDTRWFWNLTSDLYRFTPTLITENLNQHTVNERISLEGHLNATRYFYKLLRNLEGWDAE
ncbi:hypothetical protein I203_104092 [Kwoniella mangroviensis CBS 8507]|uniref:uncharacterized protein n=1 Tax=Kwoniella mangroviensis CBS 8507 TaxID=1296122 RepID=UPI00080D82DA|nr:Gly-X carboxypeptidase [Kwoniella mangroviensis CBS 8507]OCF64663.1 Gly-X carboxypeptidase [Kwoniella mangroviensis CBS 8507]